MNTRKEILDAIAAAKGTLRDAELRADERYAKARIAEREREIRIAKSRIDTIRRDLADGAALVKEARQELADLEEQLKLFDSRHDIRRAEKDAREILSAIKKDKTLADEIRRLLDA